MAKPAISHRHFITVAALLLGCTMVGSASGQSQPQHKGRSVDVGLSYVAMHSLKAASTQNFWQQGGGVEAGIGLWHGLGAAANFTGTHAGSIGTSDVPLSLLTVTAGPRYRFHMDRCVSPFGEALFGLAHGFDSLFPGNLSATADTQANSFAMQVGGGVDLGIHKGIFVRLPEVAYIRTQLPNGTDSLQNNLRIGAGIVMRFGGRG